MEKRLASFKLTLLLLYLGVLPLTPEIPLPFAFVVLALFAVAMLAAAPFFARAVRKLFQRSVSETHLAVGLALTPGSWQLLRPAPPGGRGTVRSRAPSGQFAACG